MDRHGAEEGSDTSGGQSESGAGTSADAPAGKVGGATSGEQTGASTGRTDVGASARPPPRFYVVLRLSQIGDVADRGAAGAQTADSRAICFTIGATDLDAASRGVVDFLNSGDAPGIAFGKGKDFLAAMRASGLPPVRETFVTEPTGHIEVFTSVRKRPVLQVWPDNPRLLPERAVNIDTYLETSPAPSFGICRTEAALILLAVLAMVLSAFGPLSSLLSLICVFVMLAIGFQDFVKPAWRWPRWAWASILVVGVVLCGVIVVVLDAALASAVNQCVQPNR
jgi:hypothetical protein